MRALLIFAIILIWSQIGESRKTQDVLETTRYDLESIRIEQERSLADIWNSIKNTANNAWESIKKVASNAKKKIVDWIQKIKNKAQDIALKFEERLNKMKDHIQEVIQNALNTGEMVKKCLQERKQAIDEILKNILLDVTDCISHSVTKLDNLMTLHYQVVINETEFYERIQYEINDCIKKDRNDEIQECLQNIRNGIYENMETTEESILQTEIETKGASDDLLGTIIGCTSDGLIKASSVITNETINIVECVKQT